MLKLLGEITPQQRKGYFSWYRRHSLDPSELHTKARKPRPPPPGLASLEPPSPDMDNAQTTRTVYLPLMVVCWTKPSNPTPLRARFAGTLFTFIWDVIAFLRQGALLF